MNKIYLYADGAAAQKDDIGAWAAVIAQEDPYFVKILWGITSPTTISRCELLPIIEGLRWIKTNIENIKNYFITVISDNEYTIRTLSGEYKYSKNEDLWAAIFALQSGLKIQYKWCERNTTPGGILCDFLCKTLRAHMLKKLPEVCDTPKNLECLLPALTEEFVQKFMKTWEHFI